MAKCDERMPAAPLTGNVGCVMNGSASSSVLSDEPARTLCGGGGDEESIGSRRYMATNLCEGADGPSSGSAVMIFQGTMQEASQWQTKTVGREQRRVHGLKGR